MNILCSYIIHCFLYVKSLHSFLNQITSSNFAPPNLGQIARSCCHVSSEFCAPPRLSRLPNGVGPALWGMGIAMTISPYLFVELLLQSYTWHDYYSIAISYTYIIPYGDFNGGTPSHHPLMGFYLIKKPSSY